MLALVNGIHLEFEDPMQAGDVLSLFPPVAGAGIPSLPVDGEGEFYILRVSQKIICDVAPQLVGAAPNGASFLSFCVPCIWRLFTKPAFAEGLRDHHIFSEKIFPQARGDH